MQKLSCTEKRFEQRLARLCAGGTDGSGWELRKVTTEGGQRKQRYISHLGKTEYQELKRQHKGKALTRALAQWVADREREKAG